jgi:hypothetical protein
MPELQFHKNRLYFKQILVLFLILMNNTGICQVSQKSNPNSDNDTLLIIGNTMSKVTGISISKEQFLNATSIKFNKKTIKINSYRFNISNDDSPYEVSSNDITPLIKNVVKKGVLWLIFYDFSCTDLISGNSFTVKKEYWIHFIKNR